MKLFKFTRLGSGEDVWVNSNFVVAVEPTDRMGSRIIMVTTEHGIPLVIQVTEKANVVAMRFGLS